jgi:hypothetical protein
MNTRASLSQGKPDSLIVCQLLPALKEILIFPSRGSNAPIRGMVMGSHYRGMRPGKLAEEVRAAKPAGGLRQQTVAPSDGVGPAEYGPVRLVHEFLVSDAANLFRL